jgi:hypothetical protein
LIDKALRDHQAFGHEKPIFQDLARLGDHIKGVLRSEFGRVPGGQGHLAQNHAKSLFAGYFWLDED